MNETSKDEQKGRTIVITAFLLASVLVLAVVGAVSQQQAAYASHGETCPVGTVPAHQGPVNHCVPPGEIERACAINPNAFDECRQEPPPLDERFPDQGSCIEEASSDPDAGFTKADCKDAFKDKKVKPTAPTTNLNEAETQEAAPEEEVVEEEDKAEEQQQQEEQEQQQQEEE